MSIAFLFIILFFQNTIFAQWQRASGVGDRFVYSSISVFDDAVYAGTDSGAFKSTDDGVTWFQINNGLGDTPLAVSSFAVCGDRLFAGTYSGLYASTDKGQSWQLTNMTDPVMSLSAVDPVMLVGVPGGGLYRSPDAGVTWAPIDGEHYYSFALIQSTLFAGTFSGLYISADTGSTWDVAHFEGEKVFAIGKAENVLYASPAGGGVYRTTDLGNSWQEAASGLPSGFQSADFYCDAGKLFVCSGEQIFLCMNPTSENPVWSEINLNGLSVGNSMIAGLAVIGDNLILGTENISTGTDGKGIWYRPLSQIVSLPDDDNTYHPDRVTLEQNYPNPFNPSTTIRYYLPVLNFVNLKIFNLLGQEVSQLVNTAQSAGYHQVMWNGKDNRGQSVSSGIYFYRLQTDRHIITKRMILLR